MDGTSAARVLRMLDVAQSQAEREAERERAPDSSRGDPYVCPVCRQPIDHGGEAYAGPVVGPLPRCPTHGLAYVPAAEVDDENPDPLLGRCVAGRFTVLGKLGSGAMGTVYRARQEAIGRDVALKILRSERVGDAHAQARFEREARATSALISPHTITVFDFGAAEDGSWFLAMELLVGETLGARLRRQGRVPPRDACRIVREALKSLAEAHAKGIIHRDMKPDNLFLVSVPDEGGKLAGETSKLLDFGIAKVLGTNPGIDQLETQAGAVFGTPRYMSPEQAQGMALDARSDLYSLSVILYAMLTGRAPFVDNDAVVVMASHITRQPPSFHEAAPDLESLPALESLVLRGLSKSAALRPQSAEDYIALLDEAVGELDVPPSRRLRWSRSWRPVRLWQRSTVRKRAVWIALATGVGLLGLSGVLASLWERGSDDSPPPLMRPMAHRLGERAQAHSVRVQSAEDSPPTELGATEASPAATPKTGGSSSTRPTPSSTWGVRRSSGDHYGRFE